MVLGVPNAGVLAAVEVPPNAAALFPNMLELWPKKPEAVVATVGLAEAAPKTNVAPLEAVVTVVVFPKTEPEATVELVLLNNELVVVKGVAFIPPLDVPETFYSLPQLLKGKRPATSL